jgi:hypothetical protein
MERQVCALGVTDFIQKEFSLHRLGDVLKRLLKTPELATYWVGLSPVEHGEDEVAHLSCKDTASNSSCSVNGFLSLSCAPSCWAVSR